MRLCEGPRCTQIYLFFIVLVLSVFGQFITHSSLWPKTIIHIAESNHTYLSLRTLALTLTSISPNSHGFSSSIVSIPITNFAGDFLPLIMNLSMLLSTRVRVEAALTSSLKSSLWLLDFDNRDDERLGLFCNPLNRGVDPYPPRPEQLVMLRTYKSRTTARSVNGAIKHMQMILVFLLLAMAVSFVWRWFTIVVVSEEQWRKREIL